MRLRVSRLEARADPAILRQVPGDDFFRAFQEIFERRFRWTVRQVVAAVDDASAAAEQGRRAPRDAAARGRRVEVGERLRRLGAFFRLLDAGIGAFIRGEPFPAEKLQNVAPLEARRGRTPG